MSPGTGNSGSSRGIVLGAVLCAAPPLVALLLLLAGINGASLALIYASIAASVLGLPAFVYGVLCVLKAVTADKRAG